MTSFSSRRCDVCKRTLGGPRTEVNGYNPNTKQIQDYIACDDCIYYAEYGSLDDMTMMDLVDDTIEERYQGAEQERGIWYHGTSSALLPSILSQGLIPDPKKRSWDTHEETSIVQPTRRSLPGIYVTTNLMAAISCAGRVARRDGANYMLVVMELQPRSLLADEDTVNHALKSLSSNVSGSAYHHVWPWFMEVYGDRFQDSDDGYYRKMAEEQKRNWVDRTAKDLFYKFKKKEPHPGLEQQVKKLLYDEGYRAMLERNVSYVEGSWDLDHYKRQWSEGFGEYGTEPPVPDKKSAEDGWSAFGDKLSRTLKDTARPTRIDWTLNTSGRVMTPVRFSGKNRIVCIVERIDSQEQGRYHSQLLVHYGKPPQKLIDDWQEAIGHVDMSTDIIYAQKIHESADDENESHQSALNRTGFWGRRGAGGLFMAKSTGRLLIPFRSAHVQEPHTWGVWGGAIDAGENPKQAAQREMEEEAGYRGPVQLFPLHVFKKGTFQYHNFLAMVPDEFTPSLNWENEDYRWVKPGEWPEPLHFGLAELIDKSGNDIQVMRGRKEDLGEDDFPVGDVDDEATAAHRLVEQEDDFDFDMEDILGEPPPPKLFTVISSHGTVTARVTDGIPVSVEPAYPDDEEYLKRIKRFDVEEWRKTYPDERISDGDTIDILDIGIEMADGRYEPPDETWREDFARERHERQQPPQE
jgi:8-oxo-dGTP pyrophosphatase MutT (NUDIX family)